jgi:RNA polymerase sigma-70 factor (ECF subfamily)
MNEDKLLAERFEAHRAHLQAVAYRMLGSLTEADDAVQEAWLRVNRTGDNGVENLGGWLTTVVARICLDMLRTRKSRGEESLDAAVTEPIASRQAGSDPEYEAILADSVGIALLVVMENLAPAERLAFVLHDMFAVPFDEIAPIVGHSPTSARQLASRARRRLQGTPTVAEAEFRHQREVVDAYLAAARGGDFNALLAVLDPDVITRSDATVGPRGVAHEIRGATAAATRAVRGGANGIRPLLVNGAVGAVVAPQGRLLMVLQFTIVEGKIVEIEAIADPERLQQIDLALLTG